MDKCRKCGSAVSGDAKNCSNCGASNPRYSEAFQASTTAAPPREIEPPVEPERTRASSFNSKFCGGCGNAVHVSATTCPHCGKRLAGAGTGSTGGKDKNIAALIAIFFGTFGAHHFYLGNSLLGVIYLVFCWTGIPTLVGFIEGLIYLGSNEQKFNQRYNN